MCKRPRKTKQTVWAHTARVDLHETRGGEVVVKSLQASEAERVEMVDDRVRRVHGARGRTKKGLFGSASERRP